MGELPRTADEFKKLVDDLSNTDIVRSLADWQVLLSSPNNPLGFASQDVIQSFTDSLVFENGGLAHAEYGMLADALTFTQFRNVWACFGISIAYLGPVMDFYCKAPKMCDFRPGSVCTIYCQNDQVKR